MCLKRPITVPFERSEPFHLLRLMGVSVPSLHIESTDSMIHVQENKVCRANQANGRFGWLALISTVYACDSLDLS